MATVNDEKSVGGKETPPNTEKVEDVAAHSDSSVPLVDDDFNWTISKFLALLSFQLGYFGDIFAITIPSALLVIINADIGPNKNYSWIATANILTAAILAPFIGRLGDIFGRRNLFILGDALGCIGCAISATGHQIPTLIGGSVLIGAGSSMHQMAWSSLSEVVPARSRPMALGLLQTSIGPASAFGPLIGYACAANSSWRTVYWIVFAIYATALILVFFFYRPINQHILEEGTSKWGQARQLDFIGILLYASGLVLFLLALSFGGNNFPWKSAGTIVPLVLGIVLLLACGIWEAYNTSPYALFPRKLMTQYRGFTVILGVIFLVGMLYYSIAVLWPQQIQALYATKPYIIGCYAMALGLSGTISGPPAGWIVKHVKQTRWVLTLFTLFMTVFCGLMAIVTPGSHIASTLLVVLVGFGVSAATVASNAMIVLAVPHEYLGVAIGLATTSRSVGGSVATTIYVSILQHDLESHLGHNLGVALAKAGLPLGDIPAVAGALATGNTTSPALGLASPAILGAGFQAIKLSYAHAFRLVYLVSIVFGVLGAICAIFSNDVTHLMTSNVDIQLEEGAHVVSHADNTHGHIIVRINSKEAEIITKQVTRAEKQVE